MPVGKTKDAGWQIGVSTTVDHPAEEVWSLLTSPRGIGIWLGGQVSIAGTKGETYVTTNGTRGQIRSYHPNDRIRLTWRPETWDHDTTVQVAIQPVGRRTRLRFHQERLESADEREQQRTHWKQVAASLAEELDHPAK